MELAAEQVVILGQVAKGYGVDDLSVGAAVELVVEPLYELDGVPHLIYRWKPVAAPPRGRPVTAPESVAVLGAGMHEWGKWGRPFHEYGIEAALAALDDAGVPWSDVQFVAGGETVRNGYPGYVAASTLTQALGWNGARVASCYAACASGVTALDTARARILAGLCDVALVVGADTTPKGFLAPVAGERWDDPDWLRFRLLGATNPTYFALYARRRVDLYGATDADFARVKVKNARHGLHNPYARYRKEVTEEEVLASPMVADPLRLLEICATSDGAAAVVLTSMAYARKHAGGAVPGAHPGRLHRDPPVPQHRHRDAQLLDRLGRRAGPAGARRSGTRSPTPPTRRPASAPRSSAWPRSTTCPPPSSSTGTRTSGCARPARPRSCSTTATPRIGGRIPVNPSGGLACFGEAVPAQAIAQVCEVTWQLRGQAEGRQVEGAKVGRHGQPGPLRPRLRGGALGLTGRPPPVVAVALCAMAAQRGGATVGPCTTHRRTTSSPPLARSS